MYFADYQNYCESVLQASEWHCQHTIITAIGKFGSGKNHQKRRFPHLLGIYLGLQLQQMFSCFLDRFGSEFHFDWGPSAVVEANYGIRFQSACITIVEDLSVDGFSVVTQVSGA